MRRFITFLALIIAFPALAQPAPPPPERATITVQGEGKSEAPPDYAAISVDLVTAAPSLEAATRAHRERAARAAAAIKSLEANGLSIESSTFRLDRIIPPVAPGQKSSAPEFRAVTTFSLKSKNIATIDNTVTKLAETGLFEIHGLRFALDENSKAIDDARRNAVRDARHRADVYAEAAGVEIGEIVEITDTAQRFPIP
ncbi:MAG: SIMPL domain-containing protein, partial [Pseudorhodoplanes sp.]